MTCSQVKEKILDYIEGKLQNADRNAIQAHLDTCTQCKDEIKHFSALNDILHSSEEIEPSSDYKEKFWAKVEKKNQFLNWTPNRVIYYGIAASILILLGIILMKYAYQTPPIISPNSKTATTYQSKTNSEQDKKDDQLIMEMNNLIELPASYTSSSFFITDDELQSLSNGKSRSKSAPSDKNKSELDSPLYTTVIKKLS